MNSPNDIEKLSEYSWLAEKNGIAIASFSNNELIMNTQCMVLLNWSISRLKSEDFSKVFENYDEFKLFLNKADDDSSIVVTIHNNNIPKYGNVFLSNDKDHNSIKLTFVPMSFEQANAEYLCQFAINTNDVFFILSKSGDILYLNQNFESLFEFGRDQLEGDPLKIFEWIDKRDLPSVEHIINDIKNEVGSQWKFEFRLKASDGKTKWISYFKKALYDGDGNIYRYVTILSDISLRKNIEIELLESELNYREIYNATSDAIFIHNADTGKIEDVNNAMLEMFGCTYEEALEKSASDLSSNSDAFTEEAAVKAVHRALIKPEIFEWQSKRTNGEVFWTEVSLRRADIHGKTKVIAVVRDISERKKALELLSENERKYKLIVEGQNELIVKLNQKHEILFASPSFLKVFGLKEEEAIGIDFIKLASVEEQEYLALALEKCNKPPCSGFFEFKVNQKTGERWYSWNYSGVQGNHIDSIDLICVGRDITYQKMVESALRESEDRFRSIVQHLSDVVFLIDEKATIKYVTPSCDEYLGLSVEELLGNNILNFIHNDDRWYAEENISLHVEGSDYSLPYEVRIKHKSGSWRIFEAKSQNMLEHRSVKSIVFTISDISERKQMEKQVLDAIIKTEEKERERFAKDLHDDLGPLLSSIKMYIGMLKKVEKSEKRDYIVKNLQEIVKEAITTTKDVSNDLNPHVLNNYGLVSALKLFIEKLSQTIIINFNENISDARFSAAIELSLYRISKELVNNTVKHAEASEITLEITEKGRQINLIYEDNGKGLPEESLRTSKPGGMGLSNIISRAKSLNAKYTFHTNLQKGFRFEMHVPQLQD